MRMELIQPFLNSADAVLAQGLGTPVSIENLSMDEEAYLLVAARNPVYPDDALFAGVIED